MTPRAAARSASVRRFLAHPAAEVAAAVTFAIYVGWPLVRPGRVVIGFDTIAYTGPNAAVTTSAWRHLRVPEWNDTIFGGVPHVANPHSAAWYPLRLPFLFTDPVRALNYITFIHLLLVAVGLVVLVRWRLQLRAPAGAVAAIGVLGSGMMIARSVQFEQLVVIAWMPWVLLLIDWVLRDARATRASVPCLAVVTATMVTGAHVQILYDFAGLAVVWTVARAVDSGTVRRMGLVVAGGALGALLAAPELIPVAEFARRAAHQTQTIDLVGQPGYVIGAKRSLVTLVGDVFTSNQAFVSFGNENMTSIGVALTVLAAIGAIATAVWRRRARWTAIALAVAGAASFVFALGPRTFVYRAAFKIVPGFAGARVPARWRDVTVLCAALLAAFAVDRVRRARVDRGVLVVGGGVVLAGALAVASQRFILPEGRTLAVWALVALGCLVALALASRRRAVVGSLLLVTLVVVEMGAMVPGNFLRSSSVPSSTAGTAGPVVQFLQQHRERVISFTQELYSDPQYLYDGLRPNVNALVGLRSIDGYDGGIQITKEWSSTVQALESSPSDDTLLIKAQLAIPLDPSLWARFGVRWALVDTALLPADAVVHGWKGPVVVDRSFALFENPSYTTEAAAYTASAPLDRTRSSGEQLRGAEQRDPAVALVDPGGPNLSCAASCASTPVALERLRPGALRATVRSSQRAIVATDEQWDPGWEATVDGAAAKVLRVDGFFVGVEVPEGQHVVEWRYHAPGLRLGLALAALAIVVCVAIALDAGGRVQRVRRRLR